MFTQPQTTSYAVHFPQMWTTFNDTHTERSSARSAFAPVAEFLPQTDAAFSIKSITLHADQSDQLVHRARVASQIAAAYAAQVNGIFVGPQPQSVVRTQENNETRDEWMNFHGISMSDAAVARQRFEDAMRALNVPHCWIRPRRNNVDSLIHESVLADLVVTGTSPKGVVPGVNTGITEAVILKSRKPCLVVPENYEGSTTIKRVLVAWDGSVEAMRSVQNGMAILTQANEVDIINFRDNRESSADPKPLQKYLNLHGVLAGATVEDTNTTIGESLLQYASRNNYDLLTLGAKAQSQPSGLVVRGLTQHIIRQAELLSLISN